VFDESFVRAARIQEYSAQERLDGTFRAVRTRRAWARCGPPRQALILVMLILVAFGTAVYLGVRNPYHASPAATAQPLRITLIPLTPTGRVPEADAKDPFAGRTAQHYRTGAEGITLPMARRLGTFSESQVMQALATTKDYLYASSIDPDELTGGDVRGVRSVLATGQLPQFDRSLSRPADDGLHAATGWLVRFDPTRVRLASDEVRVQGSMKAELGGADFLEVITDHTMVYAVRNADGAHSTASLFTVRRDLRLRFDRDDLRDQQMELVQAEVEAGPLSCATAPVEYFRPLLAGQRSSGVTGANPYDRDHDMTTVCGALSPEASISPLASLPDPSSPASRSPALADAAGSASGGRSDQ
jgi:hypothetical protein